ncbi:hypothetical protein HanHA300_Chr09g0312731 [Helianthus annuus]|nr:hypothetical protein HanHA300_Chr09g0312731 [Helianthus annuus]KAJ0706959.1 hypothetical protein HanLR1_Chr09g0313091 [Helianthus annuus]KAJ0710980.1 hypothetical protein HanOQP8_Chr09g0318681 [Helianthus annuus]
MPCDIYMFSNWIKATIAMMIRAITKKDTRERTEVHFVTVIWAKIGKTFTPKYSKKRVIWFAFKNVLERRFVGGYSGW